MLVRCGFKDLWDFYWRGQRESEWERVCERGPNFSSWVRFSGKGLAFLLEGAETCNSLKIGDRFRKSWAEGGRRYQLELCSNKAGRFLFCTAWDVEGKRFSLAFPKGRGVVGGWKLLAGKLRSLGFSLAQRGEEPKAPGGKEYSMAEAKTSSSAELRNAVWLEIEKEVIDSNEEVLNRSLVGRWGGTLWPVLWSRLS